MEEKELTLKEVFDCIEKLCGFSMDCDVKFTEYGMKSLINDVYTKAIKE